MPALGQSYCCVTLHREAPGKGDIFHPSIGAFFDFLRPWHNDIGVMVVRCRGKMGEL